MKNILITFLMTISFSSIATVETGDLIKAVEYNNSKFNIGDIKISILDTTQFQNIHGNCWIQLNQGADGSDVDISNSDLAVLKGNTLKSATGRALRGSGGLAAPLGTLQEDELKAHKHDSFGNLGTRNKVAGYASSVSSSLTTANVITNSSGKTVAETSEVGGDETRMKNLTVNYFIKINNHCE